MENLIYKHIINSPHYYVVKKDLLGRYTYINPTFASKFSFLARNLIGEIFDLTVYEKDVSKLNSALSKCITSPEETVSVKIRKKAADGGFWWMQWDVSAIKDENDNVCEILCVGHDITENQINSLRILEYAKKVNVILDGITDGFYTVDSLWTITKANRAFGQVMGMKAGELKGKNLWELFPPEEQYAYASALRKTVDKTVTSHFEQYYKGKWFMISAYPSLEGITVFFQEITERKKQEEELRENLEKMRIVQAKLTASEKEISAIAKRYESVLEGCTDAVVTTNQSGDIEFFNQAAERLWGYTKEEIMGKNVRILMSMEHAPKHDSYMGNYRKTREAQIIGKGRELEIVTKAGAKVPIHLTITEAKVGESPIFTAFIRDISKEVETRKQKEIAERVVKEQLKITQAAEEELRQNIEELGNTQKILQTKKDHLKAILNSTTNLNVLIDPNYKILFINEIGRQVIGNYFKKTVSEGDDYREYIAEGFHESFEENFEKVLQGESQYKEVEIPFEGRAARWYQYRYSPAYNEEGEVIGFSMDVVDIDEVKRKSEQIQIANSKIEAANKNLQESLDRANQLAMIVSNTTNLVVLTNAEGYITWVNEAFYKVTGYSIEEAIGKKPSHLLQGKETDKETVANISRAVRERKEITTEILNYTKAGKKYWIELKIQPIFDSENSLSGFMAIQSVITERKEHEQKILHRNQLLEEIAFIQAHEVRRPVANILGLINLIRGEEDPYSEIITTYLNYLEVAAKDLDDVIHRIVFKTNEAD